MKKHFSELRKDLTAYVSSNSNLGFTSNNNQDCIFTLLMNILNNWSMPAISSADTSITILAGIDCKSNCRDGLENLTRILQLFFSNYRVAIMHLSKLSIFIVTSFPLAYLNEKIFYFAEEISL